MLEKENKADDAVRGGSSLLHRSVREADARGWDFVDTLLDAQSAMGEDLLVIEGGRVRYVNGAFCSISGRREGELLAPSTFSGMVVPEQRYIVEDLMHRHRIGEVIEACHELTISRNGGRIVDLELAFRAPSGKHRPVPLVIVAKDITERKRMEERLQSTLGTLLAIHEASRTLSSTLEQKDIATRLLEILLRVCELSAVVIETRDEQGQANLLDARGPEHYWRPSAQLASDGLGELRNFRSTSEIFVFRSYEDTCSAKVSLCY
jgi:PAS domain S-box-containing protein